MKLQHPSNGTVVHADGTLANTLVAQGWSEADKPVEKKKPATRRKAE